jgi:signal transduction histidine kinase
VVRSRWKLLAETTALLDASLDYEETLGHVVRSAVPRVADYCVVALLNDDGSLRWGDSAHRRLEMAPILQAVQPFQPLRDTPEHPMARALRTGDAVLIPTVDEALLVRIAAGAEHLALIRRLAPVSYMAVPLVARGRVFGSLLFAATADSGRHYTERDLDLARRLGHQAAQAVDHAVLYAAAQRSARVRDELMAVVSHDLKNPLATIQLAVNFLLEDIVPNDAAHALEREQLAVITRTSERMHRLIRNLLDLSSADAGHLQVDPSALDAFGLVQDALDAHRVLAAARGITLAGDVDTALPSVLADRDRVAQLFSNLIGNALKFTPTGGRIVVSAARERDGGLAEAAPSAAATLDGLRFAVRDSGPGIAAADQPHVFDRFWQVRKTARSGTGLGLAIVRSIVEAQGGTVGVESTPGEGSTFWFTLPIASDTSPRRTGEWPIVIA